MKIVAHQLVAKGRYFFDERYFFDAHVHQTKTKLTSSARASSSVSSSMKGASSGKGAAAFISSVAVAILLSPYVVGSMVGGVGGE